MFSEKIFIECGSMRVSMWEKKNIEKLYGVQKV